MTGDSTRLSGVERDQLVARFSPPSVDPGRPAPAVVPEGAASGDFTQSAAFREIEIIRTAAEALGISNPYFRVHEGIAAARTRIEGRTYLNFASYDYLGLNGHAAVNMAARDAIERYGTSCSASRLAAERPIHRILEERLAAIHGTEDCVCFVSGHATNVTTIGHLTGKADLILYDALAHNSIQQGAKLSGAHRLVFPHNDVASAERLLANHRARYGRALIAIESHYSMDGDIPDLLGFREISRRYDAWLLVDEAHSIGVLGERGRGIAELAGADASAADFWMGTLSKTLASCGGYIACDKRLAEFLRYSAPGFVYSVGMPPAMAAAACAALDIMDQEPQRVARLNSNARLFLDLARAQGLDTGTSRGFSIVPIIVGSSIGAGRLSDALFRRGMNVQPILYPAVPEKSARLRFFLTSEHSRDDIEFAAATVAAEMHNSRVTGADIADLANRISHNSASGRKDSAV